MSRPSLDVERAVRERYSSAAQATKKELCCPVEYDRALLEAIPDEILERDYGCGDPSRHLRPGETVLDLGSGGGKICYMAAQVVGAEGRVIGIDMNDEMLELAERHLETVGNRLGYHNVAFHKGRIQDLALDYRRLGKRLADHPVREVEDLEALERWKEEERGDRPMVADESIDVVVSNCVLNLVRPDDKLALFREMHRVLRRGGRVVISDIVSDEAIPEELAADPKLWSGCVSGAYREDRFLEAFERAGFHGIEILERDAEPWQVVRGIEFRSMTVVAHKAREGREDPCLERLHAVVYRGPWRAVVDDDGHTLYRGRRMAVGDKTYRAYTTEPYAGDVIPVPPHSPVPREEAREFDAAPDEVRSPAETKGAGYDVTRGTDASCCGPDSSC